MATDLRAKGGSGGSRTPGSITAINESLGSFQRRNLKPAKKCGKTEKRDGITETWESDQKSDYLIHHKRIDKSGKRVLKVPGWCLLPSFEGAKMGPYFRKSRDEGKDCSFFLF